MQKKGKKGNKFTRILTLSLLVILFSQEVASAGQMFWGDRNQNNNGISHGTADEWITEDMVNNTPPEDYAVNMDSQGEAEDGDYLEYFLEEDIQTVSIEIEENNLNYLLQNALDEPSVMTTSVTIGDTTLGYCGLKTKGSYTLEHSATDNAGSDRFSFTVNFGKFIKKKDYGVKQKFYGCNKISFNNFFFDKSMMKEFFALKLMDEMGLPTPAYGLAKLYINGDYYGVYAMIEAMDMSIMERYYKVDKDELSSYLCKPEGTAFVYNEIVADPSPLWESDDETYEDVEDMIPTVKEWTRKLTLLSSGKDFEGDSIDVNSDGYLDLLDEVLDVDEVVRYFATHSWLCQMDNMFDGYKNFGLYMSEEGVATIVPWDYDLSFGCYYPSNAQNTANFNIDVMFRALIPNGKSNNELKSTYKNYPLFNVIFQNEALMEQYHNYMKDCSKIAALGGTVEATGKTYDPAYFNSYIEAMQEEVIEAASEKLADNVYYMNGIRQPNNVKAALPNLSKIIAMRSLGVLSQVDDMGTTVSTSGCNLETLGNAMWGESAKIGKLTIVDSATGIFASAEYKGNRKSSPELSVKIIGTNDTIYTKVKDAIGCDENSLVLYSMSDESTPVGDYTLTIPMKQAAIQSGKEIAIYACSKDGELTKLETTVNDNLYTVTTSDIRYIAVVGDGQGIAVQGMNTIMNPITIVVLVVIIAIAIAGVVGVFVTKRKKCKSN